MTFVSLLMLVSQKMSGGAGAAALGLPDPPGIPWLRIIFALLFCLVVSFAAILTLRQFKNGKGVRQLFAGLQGIASASEIDIVETRRASPYTHICLVHYKDHAYLIATTPNTVALIDKLDLDNDKVMGA